MRRRTVKDLTSKMNGENVFTRLVGIEAIDERYDSPRSD
jgi:hypothetical protein